MRPCVKIVRVHLVPNSAICGARIEVVEEPLMREIRFFDKLVDESAKGRAMGKVCRKQ